MSYARAGRASHPGQRDERALEGVADRVNRRVRRRERWAGVIWAIAVLAGLPLGLVLLGQRGSQSGVVVAALAAVMTVAVVAASVCYFSATHGRVRLFDDEMRKVSR